jgi:hypothetical protein
VSSNGRTEDFGSSYVGSNPTTPARSFMTYNKFPLRRCHVMNIVDFLEKLNRSLDAKRPADCGIFHYSLRLDGIEPKTSSHDFPSVNQLLEQGVGSRLGKPQMGNKRL